MKIGKRWLYIFHRWTGIVLCLFMALWFLSGVVMMYVGYPKLTQAERLAHLPDLVLPEICCISPQQALINARSTFAKSEAKKEQGMRERERADAEIKLTMIGDKPYWLVSEGQRGQASVDAVTGIVTEHFDEAHALNVASRFISGATPGKVEIVKQDIFTVSRALDAHRPMFHVALNDAEGTELYISPKTGEIIRDSTLIERGWNYIGSILHWLYPLKGDFFDPWRSDIIIYLSLVGTILAILGIWVGLMRWRVKKKFSNGSHSPYPGGWMRWHHLIGLAFGVITLTWIFSGLMSMNPWKIFESHGLRPDIRAYNGNTLEKTAFTLSSHEVLAQTEFGVRELSLRVFDSRPYYLVYSSTGGTRMLAADAIETKPFVMFSEDALRKAAERLMPSYHIRSAEMLNEYDNYYYSRRPHTMSGHIERRLPILRVKFDDPNHTWVHIDPYTAGVQSSSNDLGRVKRWLFNFLHSFDLRGFIDNRPIWDIFMVFFSIGGFILCISGVVIGWRRLRRPGGAPQKTLIQS